MSGVDVGAIERDLRELWKQMAQPGDTETQQAVTRACVLNLMIYAPGEGADSVISQMMAEVTTENPGRIIVMLPKRDAPPYLNAWVTAQCHLAAGGRKQVCCEEIIVRAEGDSISHLPSIAIPLLVPDLPVFLWWRDGLSESQVFQDLVETSDRVIIDSAFFDMVEVARLIQENEWIAVSDLNWARLTPWRFSIAEFYDLPDCRSCFAALDRVEIDCPSIFRVQAMLLIGWLASRLEWQWSRNDDDHLQLISNHGTVSVQIKEADGAAMKFRQGDSEFIVSAAEGVYLRSEVYLSGRKRAERIIPIGGEVESRLLSKELSISGHDTVYEKAIEFLFHCPSL